MAQTGTPVAAGAGAAAAEDAASSPSHMGRGRSEERTTPSPYWTSVPHTHTHHTHAMGVPLVPMTMPMHALTYVPMTHAPHGAVYADGGQWGSGQHVQADDEHMEGVFGAGAFFTVRTPHTAPRGCFCARHSQRRAPRGELSTCD